MKKLVSSIPLLLLYLFTNAQTIIPGDKVGIGTNSPEAKLEIRADENELKSLLILRNNFGFASGSAGSRLGFGNYRDVDVNNLGAAIDAISTPGVVFGHASHGAKLIFSTRGDGGWGLDPRMTILNTGEVGVGTLIPQTRFQVNGSSNFSSTTSFGSTSIGGASDFGLYYADRGGALAEVAVHNQGSGLMMYSNPQNAPYLGMWQTVYSPLSTGLMSNPYYPLVLGAGHEAVRIIQSGAVGIGTPNPSSRLEVSNNSNDLLTLTSTNGLGGNTVNLFMDTYGSPYHEARIQVIDANYSGHITFSTKTPGGHTNGLEERLRITNDGKVGIGTSEPGNYMLAVKGSAIFTKVQVKATSNPWPDYVFYPSYELRSLSSLETYINQYKHLPDVQSAEEVEKNGLDVGETQAILLKKIEELTLYVINQEKENKSLKEDIKELRLLIKGNK